jgi:hypothetical protein
MTRAGKEPAEDVKRAIRRAIELAGLEVLSITMQSMSGYRCRLVQGMAIPDGWPHEVPALSLLVQVGFDGSIEEVQILCAATDEDPVQNVFNAPTLQDCYCPLKELPTTVKEVWVSRRQVIDRLKSGEAPPIFDGRWTWEVPKIALPEIF